MHARPLALPLAAVVALAVHVAPATAAADAPAAPSLTLQSARAATSDAMRRALLKLPAATQQKLVGAYVAFAPDPKAPLALAACDDDGDYVVVVSDAMLTLADAVARAKATDDTLGSSKLEAYARLLAKAQRPGERLLTPPAGFYGEPTTPAVAAAQSKAFHAIASYLVATELAHMAAGDLTCARPTATHERGDDEWTAAEHESALAAAQTVHSLTRVAVADARGAELAAQAGEPEGPYLALLLPLLGAVEASAQARAAVPYVVHHPNQAVRAQIAQTAVSASRAPKGAATSPSASGVRGSAEAR